MKRNLIVPVLVLLTVAGFVRGQSPDAAVGWVKHPRPVELLQGLAGFVGSQQGGGVAIQQRPVARVGLHGGSITLHRQRGFP